MNRRWKSVFILILAFSVTGLAITKLLALRESQTPPAVVSVFDGDYIFREPVDDITGRANIPPLRQVHIKNGDIEIRVWRGFGLDPLEGVLIQRIDNQWSGIYLKNTYAPDGSEHSTVSPLKRPISTWRGFWDELVDKGILRLPLTPDDKCDHEGIDGTSYLVEINQDQTYRNYYYKMGRDTCRESKQMKEIGEFIALEFGSPGEKCKRFEWFACTMQSYSQKAKTDQDNTP